MTAGEIEHFLMHNEWQAVTCMPRICPPGWWEGDVVSITSAGFVREYEIKVSRGDFFGDRHKAKEVFPRPYGAPVVMENKHDLLAKRDSRCPVQFWYVTPAGLVTLDEVPEWAGLIEIHQDGEYGGMPRLRQVERKKAPRLHSSKPKPDWIAQVFRTCYYRFHNKREQAERLSRLCSRQARMLRELGHHKHGSRNPKAGPVLPDQSNETQN